VIHSHAPNRPQTPHQITQAAAGEAPNSSRHKALNLEGHLQLGSLSPRDGAGAAPDVVEHRARGGAYVAGVASAEAERAALLAQTQRRLIEEWPHGVPVGGGACGREGGACLV